MKGWTSCNNCPIGYICASKSALPVLVSINQYATLNSLAASTCNAGFARTSGGTCYSCPSGYTSVGGNSIRCTPCPPGHECTSSNATPSKCTNNQHAYWMQKNCKDCTDAAQQCMFRDRNYIEPCPHGTYMPTGNSASLMCVPCPAGRSCHRKGTSTNCAAGTYSLEGDLHCHDCPVGASCTTSSYTLCTTGQYSAYGSTSCSACPLGHFCPEIHQDKQPCLPGTYQDGTSQLFCKHCAIGTTAAQYGSTTCTACSAGDYCPSPDKPAIKCPFGTYSTAGSTICKRCTDGYLCNSGETSATGSSTCSNGYICNPARELAGLFHNIPCPAGFKYKTGGDFASRLTGCEPCPSGSYCPAGTENAIACLPGHYCPPNTKYATEFPCAKGTFNSAPSANSIFSCGLCTAGKYCPGGTSTPFDCPPGSYCVSGTGDPLQSLCPGGTYSGDVARSASNECIICEAGHFCPVGSIIPTPCPPGTINPSTGKQYISECVLPAAGSQATTWGNSDATGAACTAGHYCPVGSFGSPFPCPAGTFTDDTDKVKADDCTACTAGFACEEGTGAGVKEKLKCAAGHYCPAGSSNPSQYPCPAGTYSANVDNDALGDCTASPCTAGFYCLEGTTKPIFECPKGHYCPAGTKTSFEFPCAAGTYNHITKLTQSSECFVCPQGNYCVAGSTEPTVCPVGTYAPGTGYEAAHDVSTSDSIKGCLACPAGQTCETAGTVTTTTCGTGFYSYVGTTTCLVCKIGHYCPDASTTGAKHDNDYICPAGYLCPSGMKVDPAVSGDTYKCPKGHYCLAGTSSATPCLAGTYNDQLGGDTAASCQTSPAGFFTRDAATTVGTPCTAGFYCPAGTTGAAAVPCPVGKMRKLTGAGQLSDCAACTAGYYCGQATAIPTICTQGSYCLSGSETPTSCPIGTFGAKVGLTATSECTDCLPGMFCSQQGLKSPDGLCDMGYFCISKATTPNPTDGTTGNVCVAGGFCDLGSFESVSCRPGTFNTNTGGTSEAECIACTPGKY